MNICECETVVGPDKTEILELVRKCVRDYVVTINSIKSVYCEARYGTWAQDLQYFTEPIHDRYMSKLIDLLDIEDV